MNVTLLKAFSRVLFRDTHTPTRASFSPRLLYSVGSLCSMAASDTETWWHMSRMSFSSLSSNPTRLRPNTRHHHFVRRRGLRMPNVTAYLPLEQPMCWDHMCWEMLTHSLALNDSSSTSFRDGA